MYDDALDAILLEADGAANVLNAEVDGLHRELTPPVHLEAKLGQPLSQKVLQEEASNIINTIDVAESTPRDHASRKTRYHNNIG